MYACTCRYSIHVIAFVHVHVQYLCSICLKCSPLHCSLTLSFSLPLRSLRSWSQVRVSDSFPHTLSNTHVHVHESYISIMYIVRLECNTQHVIAQLHTILAGAGSNSIHQVVVQGCVDPVWYCLQTAVPCPQVVGNVGAGSVADPPPPPLPQRSAPRKLGNGESTIHKYLPSESFSHKLFPLSPQNCQSANNSVERGRRRVCYC